MGQSVAGIFGYESRDDHHHGRKAENGLEDAGRYHGAALERTKETRGPREEETAKAEGGNCSAGFHPSIWLTVWLSGHTQTNVDSVT